MTAMSAAVLAIPVVSFAFAFRAPWPSAAVPWAISLFLVAIYLLVWLWFRPSSFVVDQGSLIVRWPLRRKAWSRAQVSAVELLSAEEFRRRYGNGVRVGAGGLFGGFGLLKTRTTTFLLYVSRVDEFVLVSFRQGRPLLITPDRPRDLIAALRKSIQEGAHGH